MEKRMRYLSISVSECVAVSQCFDNCYAITLICLTTVVFRDKTCVILEGFEAEIFPLKYNPMICECKIYSVEVDLYYFK